MFFIVSPSFPMMAPTNWVGTRIRRGSSCWRCLGPWGPPMAPGWPNSCSRLPVPILDAPRGTWGLTPPSLPASSSSMYDTQKEWFSKMWPVNFSTALEKNERERDQSIIRIMIYFTQTPNNTCNMKQRTSYIGIKISILSWMNYKNGCIPFRTFCMTCCCDSDVSTRVGQI